MRARSHFEKHIWVGVGGAFPHINQCRQQYCLKERTLQELQDRLGCVSVGLSQGMGLVCDRM